MHIRHLHAHWQAGWPSRSHPLSQDSLALQVLCIQASSQGLALLEDGLRGCLGMPNVSLDSHLYVPNLLHLLVQLLPACELVRPLSLQMRSRAARPSAHFQ